MTAGPFEARHLAVVLAMTNAALSARVKPLRTCKTEWMWSSPLLRRGAMNLSALGGRSGEVEKIESRLPGTSSKNPGLAISQSPNDLVRMGEYGVKVTYSGPILFLSSGQWAHTFTSLKERLPLRNLHWRSVSRPSVRSVQELDVELVSLESVRDEPSSQIPATLLERPLLNIYFVTCEVSGLPIQGPLRPVGITP